MKSRRTQIIFTLATIILVAGFVLVPHEAHAGWLTNWFTGGVEGWLDTVVAVLFNLLLLPLANMFVQLTGYLLNTTLTLTLNMNTLVSSSGGIVDSTWSIIRDLSSILIIFFLLYTSIEIIIQKTDSKVQHLIIMVAVAGILINFSLFLPKLLSMLRTLSLAFYRAITPAGSAQWNGTGAYLSSAINDGGLSNVMMNALELQVFYNPATVGTSTLAQTNPVSVLAAGAGGVAVMIIAGLSFLAAAILFTVRIAFLIILMAFSPVYFVGMIVPKVKEKISDKWEVSSINQCLIMPIYLLFMYVAMRVITNPTFKNVLNPAAAAANPAGATRPVCASTVGVVIQYVISIVLISIPLIAAMEYASVGKDLANAATSKVKAWGKGALNKGWQETGGRGMSKLANSEGFRNFAANNKLGEFALKGTRGVAQSYNAKLDKQVKARTEFAQSLGVDQKAMNTAQSHVRNLKQQLATAQAAGAPVLRRYQH